MSHYEQRMAEIIGAENPAKLKAHIADAANRIKTRDLAEIGKLAHDPEADPNHFHPVTWATRTLFDCRKRARNKGLEFNMNSAWIVRQLERQGYRCAVSGIEFSARRPRESHKRPWMPSLDRIDCTKGYTTENVRIVCVAVNTLLQDWGDSVFREIIEASKK